MKAHPGGTGRGDLSPGETGGGAALPPLLIAVLVAAAIPLFFANLGALALMDPDEPYYAVPALEMLRTGVWSVPIFRGEPWFDKPVLFYWVVLAAFKVFGVSEWSARIGSAVAGLGGAAALAALAPRGWRRGGTHILAAVVLATSLEYAILSRAAITDATLTLFLVLGFLAMARHFASPSVWSVAAAGAAWGLAALTKGPVAVIVPVLALLGWRLVTSRGPFFRPQFWLALGAGFVATAAPWYGFMLVAHRDLLLSVFLGEGNLGRFVDPEHVQFPLFYPIVFAVGLLPWSAALPSALLRTSRDLCRGGEEASPSNIRVFALVWFLAVVLPFAVSASKLPTYVLPAFPAAALLIADYWREAFADRLWDARRRRGPRAVAWAGAAVSLVTAIGLVVLGRDARYAEAASPLFGVAAILAVAGLLAAGAVMLRRLGAFTLLQTATTVAMVLGLVTLVLPRVESTGSTRGLIAEVEARGLGGEVRGSYCVPDVSLDFYLDRSLRRETDPSDLARRVADDPGRLWVVRAMDVDTLGASAKLEVEPVALSSNRAVVRLRPGRSSDRRGEGS